MLNDSRGLSTVPITTYLYKYYSNNLLGCICLLNRSFKAPFSLTLLSLSFSSPRGQCQQEVGLGRRNERSMLPVWRLESCLTL